MRQSSAIERKQALRIAQACAQLLKERFGARRVLLFGSLAREGAWHAHSDIDLAVEGLAAEDFFPAYSACRALLPRELELDIVPLENVYPEMRARILQEVEMPQDPLLALQAMVTDELTALERVSREMQELLDECARPPTRTELRAIASILHEFYNGVERILERIILGFQESLPQGSHWHTDLLIQVAEPRSGKRPAVIDGPLQTRLQDYLDFRHFYRHAYGYTLQWNQMRWKAENLPDTLEMLRGQLQVFFQAVTSDAHNSAPPPEENHARLY